MIDKLKRFETAEYLLPQYIGGSIFCKEEDEKILIHKLNITKPGMQKLLQSLGTGAVAGTAAGAAVYAAEGASLSLLAHILVGLGLSSIPIAGPIIAATAASATVAGVGIKKTVFKRTETNASYSDYLVFGGDMNDYGRRIASSVFPPIIRYMRTDSDEWTDEKEFFLEDFLKSWGYSSEFRNYWQQIAKHASLEDLDMHINQVFAILDSGTKLFFATPKILVEKSNKHMDDYKVNGLSETIGAASVKYRKKWDKKNPIRADLAEIEKYISSLEEAKEKLSLDLAKLSAKKPREINTEPEMLTQPADKEEF